MHFFQHLKALIEQEAKSLEVERGERLIEAGQVERYLYWIEKGAFQAFFEQEERRQVFRLAYSGDFIAALGSFISGNPTVLYWECLRKSKVHRLSRKRFRDLAEAYPAAYTELLEQLLVEEMEREMDLLLPKPNERLERLLRRSPRVFQEIPAKYIANYLRMSPETLSRLQKS